MKKVAWMGGWLLALGLTTGCGSTPAPQHPGAILPLRTVRLYETGVGYFERTGDVSLASGTSLPVPAAHLDDALKTLVVVSEGGQSTVDGLEFESSVTEGMARALAGLPKTAQTELTYMRLLSSLEGEEVAVRTDGPTFVGRVIDVIEPPPESVALSSEELEEEDDGETDRKKQKAPKARKRPELMLLLLTQDNEIRQIPSTEIQSVKPLSPVTEARLGLALNALSTRAPQSRRMVRVVAHAKGPVSLGYIAETPLWRTTYRMVLDAVKPEGVLQGWALLHNDTDEDWSQVRVQLVNGRPDSFLFPMAAPRYGRRELVTPDVDLSTIPQLLDQTPDAIWGDHADLGESTGYGTGYGSGSGRLGSSRRSNAPQVRMGATSVTGYMSASDLLSIGNLAATQQATGVESAALFIYTLPRPLDLRAHGSALVPFVQATVTSNRITWVDGDDSPRMGVLFTNLTRQTLPAGPIAFFSEGGFAGESALERLKPNEQRYLLYGADIDVETKQETDSSVRETKQVELRQESLLEHFVRTDELRFGFENRSGQPRSVHWALTLVANAKLEGADEVRYDETTNRVIAVFRIPARQKVERKVRITQGLQDVRSVEDASVEHFDTLSKRASLPEDQRKVLTDAAEQRRKIDKTQEEMKEVQEDIQRLEKDLERLREHLKALGGEKGAGVAANPFVKRILDAEDRLEVLRAKERTLADRSEEEKRAVRRALKPLSAEKDKPGT